MFQQEVLGLEEARRAVDAMLQAGMKEPARPIAIVIVDDHCELVAFARMDGARPQNNDFAFKKAYTSARLRGDSGAIAQRMKDGGRSAPDFGYPNLLFLQGGLLIARPGSNQVLGAIGVSGLRADEDEGIAKIGLAAMGLA